MVATTLKIYIHNKNNKNKKKGKNRKKVEAFFIYSFFRH